MKEDLCYVAFNPSTEEQVKQPDTVYKLPDGQTIRVSFVFFTNEIVDISQGLPRWRMPGYRVMLVSVGFSEKLLGV